MRKRSLVISAINFSEGGPLTVLLESLDAARTTLGSDWSITALVHNKDLVRNPEIRTIEFPESKSNWFRRLRYEWIGFSKISRAMNVDLWVSLHDITPRVKARRQVVYCHNPAPFYRPTLTEMRFDPRFILFNKFYGLLYRSFIRRNYAVIVQQSWLREMFKRFTAHDHIIVAYPGTGEARKNLAPCGDMIKAVMQVAPPAAPIRLLYPALPRVFKNIEILCEAVRLLPFEIANRVDLRLTISGSENRWAAELVRRYGGLPGISMIGRQNRSQMDHEYSCCDAVLFPSRLETWGLPITEAKSFRKPLLLADLPYAHETVGDYDLVEFLPADRPAAWAAAIADLASGRWAGRTHHGLRPEAPFAEDWPTLWTMLTEGL